MSFKLIITGFVFLIVLFCNAFDVTVKKDKDGDITLENQFILAKVTSKGGKLIVFEDNILKTNYALTTSDWAGIGKFRIFEDTTCREFLHANYKVKILQNSKTKAVVECSYIAKRKDHPWRGFEVIKRYSLKKGENRLRMDLVINSYGNSGKLTPFMHNYLRIRNKSYAFAQTANGLFCQEIKAANSKERTKFVRNLTEKWGAVITPETQNGIIGLDTLDSTKEMLFWFDESKPTFEPVFETAKFLMNSSWSNIYYFAPLRNMKSCHFATENYVGGFCIENSKSVMKFFPLTDIGQVKVKIYTRNNLIKDFSIDTKVGKSFTIPVKLKKEIQKLKLKIEYQQQNKTHEIFASPLLKGNVSGNNSLAKEEKSTQEYAKCHVPKGKMFVSKDMTVPLGFFAITNKLAKNSQKTMKLIIDVPEGITLMNPMAHYGNCHKQISKTLIKIKGQPYNRYVIPKLGFRNTVFASTTWNSGKQGIMYYQLKWKNGEDERKSIQVEALTIPRAPFPKQLITNIPGFGMLASYIDCWPNFYEAMRHVGSNTISSSGTAVRNAKTLKQFYQKAQQEGFYIFANFLPFHLADKSSLWMYNEDINNFCALSLAGKDSKWPCPSYRGKAFQYHVELAALPGKLGATMLALDTEMWNGADYCFCNRCLKLFQKFMKENHPKQKYLSPKIFRNYPEKYPQYNKIWDDFKASLGNEMYSAIVNRFNKNLKEAGTKGPYMVGTYDALPPGTIYSMFLRLNDLLKAKLVNHVQPSPYTRGNALKFAESVKQARNAIKNSNILTWMSAGGVYSNDEYPGRDFRYCLLENFINGARGYLILPWYGLDAEDLKEHAIAMQMVVPVEDIIVDGKVITKLIPSNLDVKICGLQKGKEQLILISEYYDTKATSVSFKLNALENCQAIDMLTGEKIASIVKGNNVIHVNIPANDRAILLYVGNRKLDFSNRQIPNRKVKGIAKKSPSLATKQQNNEDKKAFEGKLVISKDNLVISNNWYKVSFFKNSPYSEINFVKTSKAYQFFLSNAIRYRNKNFSVLSKKSKRELKKSLDGKKIDLTFHEKFTFPDRTISSQITFTFWNDRPVIKFSGQIKQDSQAENTRITGSLNSWWFKKIEAGKVMHLYSTGPVPRKNGLLVDLDGSIEAGWRKKYKYFSLSDGNNAFGIITPSLANASLYVSKKKHGYISGSKIKMDGNIYKTDHYIYIGSEKELDMWAEKIYTSQHK